MAYRARTRERNIVMGDHKKENLSEVFNRYILDVRNKPVVTMLTGIYDKRMVRYDGKREGGHTAGREITHHYTEKLKIMKTFSRKCTAMREDVGLWQVKSGEHTYEVNLEIKRVLSGGGIYLDYHAVML
jgi:hypothetical protein